MYLRVIGAAFALVASCTVAWATDPAGHYRVIGDGPSGGGTYSGEVDVSKTGDTYRVVWIIGRQTFIGTGIGNDEFLTVSYKSGRNTGIALYGHDEKDGWKGIWTYAGGRTVGTEKWRRD